MGYIYVLHSCRAILIPRRRRRRFLPPTYLFIFIYITCRGGMDFLYFAQNSLLRRYLNTHTAPRIRKFLLPSE